jgi:DNA modification methylase
MTRKKSAAARESVIPEHPQPSGAPAAVYVLVSELHAWKNNPRRNEPAVPRVVQSIREFGFGAPIVARFEDGEIIAGHTRLRAAEEIGLERVPVRFMTLEEAKSHALALADNKLGELAEWDDKKVLEVLEQELEGKYEAMRDVAGFDQAAIDILREKVAEEDERTNPRPKLPKLADRFLVPPFSVLDARQGYWQDRKRQWLALGIEPKIGSEVETHVGHVGKGDMVVQLAAWAKNGRRKAAAHEPHNASVGSGGLNQQLAPNAKRPGGKVGKAAPGNTPEPSTTGTSVFDPVLCEIALRWFCPKGGRVLDPFAGGTSLGIVASTLGFNFVGVEVRANQVHANERLNVKRAKWVLGDSAKIDEKFPGGQFDLVLTDPPYFNLEKYSGDKRDGSSRKDYATFMTWLRSILARAARVLRKDRFFVVKIGEVRGSDGNYVNLVGDTIRACMSAGLKYYNEAILITKLGSLPVRAGRVFSASRKLGKTHQQVLVFVKGDVKRACAACGEVEVADVPTEETAFA